MPYVIWKQKQSIPINHSVTYFVTSLLRNVCQVEPAVGHAGEDGETHEGERRAQEDAARAERGPLQGERARRRGDPRSR